jgi:hypothetical protein
VTIGRGLFWLLLIKAEELPTDVTKRIFIDDVGIRDAYVESDEVLIWASERVYVPSGFKSVEYDWVASLAT